MPSSLEHVAARGCRTLDDGNEHEPRVCRSVYESIGYVIGDDDGDGVEVSTVPAATFHAATAIKTVVLRDWSFISKMNVHRSILTRILELIVASVDGGASRIQMVVVRNLIKTVAVLMKRGWFENVPGVADYVKSLNETRDLRNTPAGGDRRDILWSAVNQMQGSTDRRIVSLILLENVCQEMYGQEDSTAVGMLWSYHVACRASFQVHDLARCCSMAVSVLSQISGNQMESYGGLVSVAVQLMMTVLYWDVTCTISPLVLMSNETITETPLTVDSADWRPLLLDVDIVSWLFNLAIAHLDLSPGAMECVQRLVSIRGKVFDTYDDPLRARVSYVLRIMSMAVSALSTLIPSPNAHTDVSAMYPVSYDLVEIINVGIHNIKPSEMLCIPLNDQLATLYKVLFLMANFVSMETYGPSSDNDMTSWATDLLSPLLEVWVSIVSSLDSARKYMMVHRIDTDMHARGHGKMGDPDVVTLDLLSSYAYEMYLTYVYAQLSSRDNESSPVIDDELASIGMIGRGSVVRTLQLSSSLLSVAMMEYAGDRQSQRPDIPQCFVPCLTSRSSRDDVIDNVVILLRLCGVLVADTFEGELESVPLAIESAVNSDGGDVLSSLDIVVGNCFNLLKHVKQDTQTSPALVEVLAWFLKRWSGTYLMHSDSGGLDSLPQPLEQRYCGGNGMSMSRSLFCDMSQLLSLHTGDPDVASIIIDMFVWMSKNPGIRTALVTSDEYLNAARMMLVVPGAGALDSMVYSAYHSLPDKLQRLYVKSILLITSGDSNIVRRNNMIDAMMRDTLVVIQMAAVECSRTPRSVTISNPKLRVHLFHSIDVMRGVAQACVHSNSDAMIRICNAAFVNLIEIMRMYPHDSEVVTHISKFTRDVSHYILPYLCQTDMTALMNVCTHVVDVVCETMANLKKIVSEPKGHQKDDEDTMYSLSLAVVEMCIHAVNKAFLDFGDSSDALGEVLVHDGRDEIICRMVFRTLAVVPSMFEFLAYPAFAKSYMTLLTTIVTAYAPQVAALGPSINEIFTKCVVSGVDSSDQDIARSSADIVNTLAEYVYKSRINDNLLLVDNLRMMMTKIWHVVLFQVLPMSMLEPLARALYSVICISPPRVPLDVFGAPMTITDPVAVHTVQQSIITLLGKELELDRKSTSHFCDNLSIFISSVRGVLQVK